ncbi:MAG: hypothetical protein E7634_00975 [Ruminococcaceae bacterium]|nr:hypothetical protein [Oscillospiraceae bacterium]
MTKLRRTVRLSVILLLIISMLLTPMSPIFAVPNEKTDDADLVVADTKVETEKKEPELVVDEETGIFSMSMDPELYEKLYSAPNEVLNGTTSDLLEYFLDSHILKQQLLPLSSTNKPYKLDFTPNIAFKELVSRKDFLQMLEQYAKDAINGTRSELFAERKLEKILEQDSVKAVFWETADSSLNYPVIANLYSEDTDIAIGDYVNHANSIAYFCAEIIETVIETEVILSTPERELTDDEIELYELMLDDGGNTKLAEPTANYNCHSFAWYDNSYSNPYWLFDIEPYLGMCTQIYNMGAVQSGDIVVYYDSDGDYYHSGIVHSVSSSGNLMIRSKWGPLGVYEHSFNNLRTLLAV